jgi:hypothetical protein
MSRYITQSQSDLVRATLQRAMERDPDIRDIVRREMGAPAPAAGGPVTAAARAPQPPFRGVTVQTPSQGAREGVLAQAGGAR